MLVQFEFAPGREFLYVQRGILQRGRLVLDMHRRFGMLWRRKLQHLQPGQLQPGWGERVH